MNIKDLSQGSYTTEAPSSGTMNVNSLPQGSYQYEAKPYDPASTDINKSAALLGLSTSANEKLQNINSVDPETVNNPDKIAPFVENAQNAQADAQQAESQATLGNAVKTGVKDFANETIRGIGSALRSPIDIVRGLFGKAPLSGPDNQIGQFGGGTVPTIQSEAATNTGKVFDQQMSPLQATGSAVAGAVSPANILGVDDAVRGVSNLAEKAAETGQALIQGGKDLLEKRATNKIIQEVSPRLTPQVAEDATTKTSLLRGKTTIVPTDRTKEVADAVRGVVKGKSFSQDKELVKQALGQEADALTSKVEIANHPVPRRELYSAISKAERPVLISSDTTMNNAYNKVLNKASEIISKNSGDVKGSLQGRKEFDNFVSQQFPNLYESDTMTPMRTAIKGIRSTWNDFTASQLPNNIGFKNSLKKQNLMYEAIDNLSEKAAKGAPKIQGEIGTTRIDRFAEKHPTMTKAAKYAGVSAITTAGGAGAYEAGKATGILK